MSRGLAVALTGPEGELGVVYAPEVLGLSQKLTIGAGNEDYKSHRTSV